jgi:hypothetical protein
MNEKEKEVPMKKALYNLGWGLIWFGAWLAFLQPDRVLILVGLVAIPCGAALAVAMLKKLRREEAQLQPIRKSIIPRRGGYLIIFVLILLAFLFLKSTGDISCQDGHLDIRTSKEK